jgi:TonB family protein
MAGGGNGAGGTGSGPGGPGTSGTGPAGIYVGGPNSGGGAVSGATAAALPPGPRPTREQLLAAARPRATDVFKEPPGSTNAGGGTNPGTDAPATEREVESAVFREKRFYQMTLNMPNLTSSGGSWIVRFAELNQSREGGELSAPIAISKVDPAYPAALRRAHIEGVVMLYAIIRADGSVAEVRVLRGIEGAIDESARKALARWRFRPGKKNGAAVDLEAVVSIPFKLGKTF